MTNASNEPIIRIEHVWKFFGQMAALQDVSLDVYPGQKVVIIGPSGSGKSTLMNIIGCLDTPTDGEYVLHGKRVDQLDENQLSTLRNKEIGFIFQSFQLLPRQDALSNVELPLIYQGIMPGKRREMAMEAVRKEQFPQYPSRMHSLYASSSLENARCWFQWFTDWGRPTLQIVRLRVEGRVFTGNANLCFDGTLDKAQNRAKALRYAAASNRLSVAYCEPCAPEIPWSMAHTLSCAYPSILSIPSIPSWPCPQYRHCTFTSHQRQRCARHCRSRWQEW